MCRSSSQNSSKISLLLLLVLVTSCWLTVTAMAVELKPGKGIPDLQAHLSFHGDPSARLGTVLQRFREGKFEAEMNASAQHSNSPPVVWAAAEIINATLDDGRAPDPYVVTLALALPTAVDIYVIREGGFTESLLNYASRHSFVSEDHSVTRLRTRQFEIAPGERVILMTKLIFGPIQSFRLALETPVELEASAFSSGIYHTAFYAFAIACLVFFYGFHAAMKNWIGFIYAFLFTVALGFIAFIDGLLFRFVYPDAPQWHSPAGFGFLFAISGVGLFVAGRSMRVDGQETFMSTAVSALSILSIIGFLISLYSPSPYTAVAAYILLALVPITTLMASRLWRRREGNVQISSMIVAAVSVVCVCGVLAAMVTGWANNFVLLPDAVKAAFAAMLLATMTSLTVHMMNLRRNHAKAVKAQIDALKEEARRSQELLQAEQNYTRARELAALRQRQLATASHDLKQPLASLRMSFDSISAEADPTLRSRMHEAFDYMEQLSVDYLKQTTPEKEPADSTGSQVSFNEDTGQGRQEEAYELALVLGAIHQMFNEEAISKGLTLHMVGSSLKTQVPALVIMRIVSNLVSNAVKHTLTGRVLFGVRRQDRNAVIQVWDTGPGMSKQQQMTFRQAYVKSAESGGHGLGLAVCFELSEQYGLDLTAVSQPGKGTRFDLLVPVLSE